MGVQEKNQKIKMYSTWFEKEFFTKNTLRGLQRYIFPLHNILYGIGKKVCKISDGGDRPPLKTSVRCMHVGH